MNVHNKAPLGSDRRLTIDRSEVEFQAEGTKKKESLAELGPRRPSDGLEGESLAAELMAAAMSSGGKITVSAGSQTITVEAPQKAKGADLPAIDSTEVKALKELDEKFRLYKKEGKKLVLISGGEAFERLRQGKPVEIVTRTPGTTQSHRSSSGHSSETFQGVWSRIDNAQSSRSSSVDQVTVPYTSSPITSFDALKLGLVDTSAPGVGGATRLPGTAGTVVAAYDFESMRREVDFHSWGVFATSTKGGGSASRESVHSGGSSSVFEG